MIGCLGTRVRKQPIIALYFESENELKFYNRMARPNVLFVCLISFFTSQSTIFQLCRDGSFWVEQVSTKQGLMCPVQRHNAGTPVRLEPATPLSRVMHSTTEPLHSSKCFVNPYLDPNCLQKLSADEISM